MLDPRIELQAGSCAPPVDSHIQLRDGRALAFAEFGDPGGRPLFFFHGGGSTRLTRHPDDSILEDLGIRFITVDRPGVGRSDAHPHRRLLDWPSDVHQLADALLIDRFAALGWSAGGPFALACAYRMPDRVEAAGVISGLAPFHWPGAAPTLASLRDRACALAEHAAARGRGRWTRFTGANPRPAYSPPSGLQEIRAVNRQTLTDLIRARDVERVFEVIMLVRPWGFRLRDIETPVHLWHGSRDRTTPLYMAEYLHRSIPGSVLTVFPDEGHHAGFTHWREVAQTLTACNEHKHVAGDEITPIEMTQRVRETRDSLQLQPVPDIRRAS